MPSRSPPQPAAPDGPGLFSLLPFPRWPGPGEARDAIPISGGASCVDPVTLWLSQTSSLVIWAVWATSPAIVCVHTHTHTHTPLVSSYQGEISSPDQVTLLCVLGLAAATGDPKDCSHCPSIPQLIPLPPNPPWPWPMPARDTRHGYLLSYVYICLPNLFVTSWRVGTVSCSLSPQNLA